MESSLGQLSGIARRRKRGASQLKQCLSTNTASLPNTPHKPHTTPCKDEFCCTPSPTTRRADLPLYDEVDIPLWMKGNTFIRSYYRCNYTTSQCLKSILSLHNETMNIWTHLIGFVVAAVLSLHILLHLGLNRTQDYVIFSFFECSNLILLSFSSIYHTLSGHRCERVHNAALALDYWGITLMIVGSFYPPVFYMFSCMPLLRNIHLVGISVLGVIGLVGPVFPRYNSEHFYTARLILYVSLASMGILPLAYMRFGLPTNELTQPMYTGLVLMLLFYAVGMVIYIFKVPERWFPGEFDVWLHSHQLWHFFIVAAAVVHYFTCMGTFQLWTVTGAEACTHV